jgi:hypothetical protein
MKTQQSIKRESRVSTFSMGMTVRTRVQSRFRWFRPPGNKETSVKKINLEKRQRTNFLKRFTMKIRIRLLRWLSLLQFPALPGYRTEKLSHFALFRRPPAQKHKNDNYKTLKYKLLN